MLDFQKYISRAQLLIAICVLAYVLAPCPVKASIAAHFDLEYQQPFNKSQATAASTVCGIFQADQTIEAGTVISDHTPRSGTLIWGQRTAIAAIFRRQPTSLFNPVVNRCRPALYILYRQLKRDFNP